MPRSQPLLAAVLTVVALAVAWLGTAHALASVEPARAEAVDASTYVFAALASTCLVIATCLFSVPWGLLGSVGVTASLWWGAGEARRRLYSGGWLDGMNDAVYLVPITAAGVCLIAVVTCSVMSAAAAPRPRERRAGNVVL